MKKIIILLFIIIASIPIGAQEIFHLKIGVYENPPKIFTDKNGIVSGFWADITNYIAGKEGWEIEWVPGNWDQCLKRLENNEIDIMVDTGVTPARQEKFIFSNETVLMSWSRLYTQQGVQLESIMDLEGKSIAGLKGSFNIEGPEGLEDILNKFGIDSKIIEMKDYHEVFKAIQSKEVYAGITNKDFGAENELEYKVQKSSIIFQPARLQFAFSKNSKLVPELIKIIDTTLLQLKGNSKSIYFSSMEKYLGGAEVYKIFPIWIKTLIAIISGLLIIFFIFNIFLKHLVNKKTILLQQDIEKRKQVEENLESSRSLLQSELEASADGILAVGMNGTWLGYNQNFLDIWNIPDSIAKQGDDANALEYITNKLKNPDKFHSKVKELYNNPERESFDIIELKGGRIFERYSKPQKLKGKIVGRVWSFLDITDKKQELEGIKHLLSEKEIILKEVHHRIKNNFATIISLLSLQSQSITNSEAVSALQEAMGRVNSMQVLYEKLLLTEKYGTTSVKQYLENLMDDIITFFPENFNITIEKHIDNFQLDPNRLVPLGIIINELLTNIMKYAFNGRDSGKLELILKKEKGNITLTIQDNGIGLPENFNIETQTGFGLMLIKMLTKQLKGNFSIESNEGTVSTLEFSI